METETQTTTEGTTQAAPEMVRVEDASMEDLDSFIEQAKHIEDSPEPKEETPQYTDTQPADAESQTEAEPQAPVPQNDPRVEEDSRARLARLERQLEGLELVTKRRTSELSDVKQQLAHFINAKSQGLEERMATNPLEATDDLIAIREARARLNQVDQEAVQIEATKANQAAVLRNVDLEDTPIHEIAQVFLADGIDPQVVEQYKANPFAIPATTTIQAAKRLKAEKYFMQALRIAQTLKAENEKLKGRGNADPLRKVEQVARSTPGITGRSGGAAQARDVSIENIPVEDMSMEQLDALIRRGGR